MLITSAAPGATLRYTTNGVDPTESDPEVSANGDVLITGTTTLKARAWVPDRAPRVVASATCTLQPAAPTVTPGTGTYVGPQTVTLSAADPQTGTYVGPLDLRLDKSTSCSCRDKAIVPG